MRHFFILAALCLCLPFSLSALKYNGCTLAENNSFTHALLCNTPSDVQEVSGLACSRLTPGFLWTVGDDDSRIYALDMQGRKCLSLTLQGKQKRDWEDICIASINGIPHLMIGAFGDNDLVYANNYHIYVFPEPAIAAYSGSTPTRSVTVQDICYAYPNGQPHNAETLMFDSINQTIFVVNKVKDAACTVFSLAYQPAYSGTPVMTQVCVLGRDGEKFDFVTAGDITSDGSRIAIKNKKHVLIWTRNANETVAQALARQPLHVADYTEETQGESFAWNISGTAFYTTSDEKNASPIYLYTDTSITTDLDTPLSNLAGQKMLFNGRLFIYLNGHFYDLLGNHYEGL